MAPDATQAQDPAAPVLQHASRLRELPIIDRRKTPSTSSRRRPATVKGRYARYIDRIDPQRDWIEKNVKNRVSSDTFDAESNTPKTQKPLVSQGLEFGAGDRGRTDDLMLGKHTL